MTSQTYATGRRYLDADSHLMELPDFLTAHADPGMGERIPRVNFDSGGKLSKRLATYGASRRHDRDSRKEQEEERQAHPSRRHHRGQG